MDNSITLTNGELATTDEGTISREAIIAFEEKIKSIEGSFQGDSDNCPLKHTFSDGIYVREITIPEGMVVVGKIHKHEHPNFLLKGTARVITENGEEIIEAPCSIISEPGTKRALYAETELVWTTIHLNPTNTQDLEEIEKIVIAPSYKAYDKFILQEKGILKKLKSKLIRALNL